MRSTTRADVLKIPRIQIGTVMLLIAIMALCAAMVAKGRRAEIREEELRAQLASQRVQAVLHSLNAQIKRQSMSVLTAKSIRTPITTNQR
jgi:hypothetical protein